MSDRITESWERPGSGAPTFHRWADCSRCGMPWKEKRMRLQRGVKVCPECFDDPAYEDERASKDLPEHDIRTSSPWTPDGEDR